MDQVCARHPPPPSPPAWLVPRRKACSKTHYLWAQTADQLAEMARAEGWLVLDIFKVGA